jgi:hypothetical protein
MTGPNIGGLILAMIFGPPLLYLAVTIPLGFLGGALRGWMSWRRVPLQTKNQVRGGGGAALVMLAIGLWARGLPASMPPIGGYLVAGMAAFGLLWLVVGVHGAHGARFDFMSAFWWAVAAIGCVALLIFKGIV